MRRTERAHMEKPIVVDAEPKHSPSLWSFYLWPAVVLMVYVLSVGPVDRFIYRSPNMPQGGKALLVDFYLPLRWTCEHIPLLYNAFLAYDDWWNPR
jgi:hypothetical protein